MVAIIDPWWWVRCQPRVSAPASTPASASLRSRSTSSVVAAAAAAVVVAINLAGGWYEQRYVHRRERPKG